MLTLRLPGTAESASKVIRTPHTASYLIRNNIAHYITVYASVVLCRSASIYSIYTIYKHIHTIIDTVDMHVIKVCKKPYYASPDLTLNI